MLLAGMLLCLGALNVGCSSRSTGKSEAASTGNVRHFANSKAGLSSALLEHYVDFSFDYPDSWKLIPSSAKGNEKNFVKVERAEKKGDDDLTLENFAVGDFTLGAAPAESDLSALAEEMSGQLARAFPNYKRSSLGFTTIGKYRAYEFRFASRIDDATSGLRTIWGRCVFVMPPAGTGRGVLLAMLATNLAAGFASEDDIGVKGELPTILRSFKFGE